MTDTGIIMTFVPRWVMFKRNLVKLWKDLFEESVLDINITNKTGEKNIKRLVKEGYLLVDHINYKFSDIAIENMIRTYDPVLLSMSISGDEK